MDEPPITLNRTLEATIAACKSLPGGFDLIHISPSRATSSTRSKASDREPRGRRKGQETLQPPRPSSLARKSPPNASLRSDVPPSTSSRYSSLECRRVSLLGPTVCIYEPEPPTTLDRTLDAILGACVESFPGGFEVIHVSPRGALPSTPPVESDPEPRGRKKDKETFQSPLPLSRGRQSSADAGSSADGSPSSPSRPSSFKFWQLAGLGSRARSAPQPSSAHGRTHGVRSGLSPTQGTLGDPGTSHSPPRPTTSRPSSSLLRLMRETMAEALKKRSPS